MPLQIIREDITKVKVDAIVNPTDSSFSHTGGTDKRIHDVAGIDLTNACNRLKRLDISGAVITPSFNMDNCNYIIHTFGPIYIDGHHKEHIYLKRCYENILDCAKQNNIESIAIPLISTGTFGYPKKQAMKIATDVITDFIYENEMDVYLLVYDKEAFDISTKLYKDVKNYLNENGIFDNEYEKEEYNLRRRINERNLFYGNMPEVILSNVYKDKASEFSFENFKEDESFIECLKRLMIKKGLYANDVYNGSNISRQAFNGIYNDEKMPKKNTVLALCIGLKLNIDEADDFVEKAGYSFTNGNKHDYIVRYFIENEDYDIHKINMILLNEDLPLLGKQEIN